MAKWGEIKCPNCAENDALWEGMERALEESDARWSRSRRWMEDLERWLEESETREETLNDRITMLEEHLCLTEEKLARVIAAYRIEAMRRDDYSHDAFDQHIAELKGQEDE